MLQFELVNGPQCVVGHLWPADVVNDFDGQMTGLDKIAEPLNGGTPKLGPLQVTKTSKSVLSRTGAAHRQDWLLQLCRKASTLPCRRLPRISL